MKQKYRYPRIGLFICLLSFQTFSSCVHTSQALRGSGWTLAEEKMLYVYDNQYVEDNSASTRCSDRFLLGLVIGGIIFFLGAVLIGMPYLVDNSSVSNPIGQNRSGLVFTRFGPVPLITRIP